MKREKGKETKNKQKKTMCKIRKKNQHKTIKLQMSKKIPAFIGDVAYICINVGSNITKKNKKNKQITWQGWMKEQRNDQNAT